jgi:hypothetical protein
MERSPRSHLDRLPRLASRLRTQNRPRAEAPSPAKRRLLVVAITDGGPARARSESRCGDRGIAIPVTRGGTVPDAKATVGLMRAFRAEQVSGAFIGDDSRGGESRTFAVATMWRSCSNRERGALRGRGHARNHRRSSSQRAAARRCWWSSDSVARCRSKTPARG